MVSVFGWPEPIDIGSPDPNTALDQSEHALHTCYFIKTINRPLLRKDWNGQFQCLATFLLKHEKQNPSPQLKRSYQK